MVRKLHGETEGEAKDIGEEEQHTAGHIVDDLVTGDTTGKRKGQTIKFHSTERKLKPRRKGAASDLVGNMQQKGRHARSRDTRF